MNPDEKELLDKTYRIARENNKMLHSIRRSAFIWGLIKILVWVAVLGLPIWFYFQYVGPTIENISESGSQFGQMFQDFLPFFGGEEQAEN